MDIHRNTTLAYAALKNAFTENASSVADPSSQQSIRIYPNPATDNVVLKLERPNIHNITISIATITGSIIASAEMDASAGEIVIPLNQYRLKKGMYILGAEGESLQSNMLLFIQ